MNQNKSNIVIVGLIILTFVSRILNSHYSWLSNFSPIAAVAIFGAVNFQKRWVSIALPLVLLFLTDVVIALDQHTAVFHKYIIFTYGAFLAVGTLSYFMRANFNTTRMISASLLSSILFFLISNFGVWFISGSGYPKNLAGLLECYAAGIPFFKYTMAGDLFFVMVLFGSYELVKRSNLIKANA